MYKQDFALNNEQHLICDRIQPTIKLTDCAFYIEVEF